LKDNEYFSGFEFLGMHLHPMSFDMNKCIIAKENFQRTPQLLGKEKIGFFKCCHFILSELCPFFHIPHYRHDWPINCILLHGAFDKMMLVVMKKPKLVDLIVAPLVACQLPR
jgi:hypothetical protein